MIIHLKFGFKFEPFSINQTSIIFVIAVNLEKCNGREAKFTYI